MKAFVITSAACFIFYLVLTAGSGAIGLWSIYEIIAGLLLSIIVGFVSQKYVGGRMSKKALDPMRWMRFFVYLIYPLFWEMLKSNVDVAIRVITMDIHPGIVKIDSKQNNDIGVTLLANSITLTPGTLTVDVDEKNNLYVHWIDVKKKQPKTEDVCGKMADWVRRITQ
ncbi:MAG: Na+/H+ antiporter subunit E [Candidatus Diapherotrites archaeon]|nr:Na+/H+ antiporter subunit E [Candidatus Diapherotrites archaeon]